MREGYSADGVRAAERPLLDAAVPLMARAAAGLARGVEGALAARGRRTGRVLVLAGSGDNGGDALVAAALLLPRGNEVVVARLGRRVHERALAAALHAGAVLLPPDATAGRIAAEAAGADVLLDGLLGIGARGGLRPPARQAVLRLLESGRGPVVVAVDLPSGLGPDDGVVHPPMIRPDVVVTFGAMKAGLLRTPGAVARVHMVDIGLDPASAGVAPSLRLPF